MENKTGKSPMFRIRDIMDTFEYVNIEENSLGEVTNNIQFIYHHNDLKHTYKIVKDWLLYKNVRSFDIASAITWPQSDMIETN